MASISKLAPTRAVRFWSVSGKVWTYAVLAGAVVGVLVWQHVGMNPDDTYKDSSTSSAAIGRQVGTGSRALSEFDREDRPAEETNRAVAARLNATAQDLPDAIRAVQVEATSRDRSSSTVQEGTASSDMAPALDAHPQKLSDAIRLVQTATNSQPSSLSTARSSGLTAAAVPLDEAVKEAQYVSLKQQFKISAQNPFLVQIPERSLIPRAPPGVLQGKR